ncbi:hypothetical protein [Rubrivivax gelatinosus]|uniref:Uncharacterized protein n=1 Tax=Rubrivivax gelatinosus TaxID=28068 RepID=A0A4R2M5M5_RUBGE|nr:hypothetical protein [Rubrivivax gelatinosus]MBK1688166.1 hypothetical protein [Rubrivivax gelatinosus]TCP02529.1 hypothetical protein EV684_10691 [Rubrivivax gelatinosus]
MTPSAPALQSLAQVTLIQIVSWRRDGAEAAAVAAAIKEADADIAAVPRESALAPTASSRALYLIESAEASICRLMAAGRAPREALEHWLTRAEQAVVAAEQNPLDVVLIESAALESSALAQRLQAWAPSLSRIRVRHQPIPQVTDPALWQAALRLTRAHPGVQHLKERLRMSGIVAGPEATPAAAPTAVGSPEPAAPPAVLPALPEDREQALRGCLADAQQELEDTYLRLRDLESQMRGGAVSGRFAARAGHMRLTEVTPTSVRVELRPLDIVGLRRLPRVDARLLLVDGQPALRLYATGESPEVVQAWKPDGAEQGLDYMQFRPADAADRQRLQFLGSADWYVVTGVTTLLGRQLPELGEATSTAVTLAARRLRRQVAELPHRLRYDGVSVGAEAGDVTVIQFSGASFGPVELGRIRLLWSAAGLRWRRDDKVTEPPLAGWPVDAQGLPTVEWQIPVADSRGAAERAAAWQALTDNDKAMVVAVLDAMPAATMLEGAAFGAPAARRAELAELAPRWLRQAQAAAAGRRGRRLARLPLLGRLFAA